MPYRRLPPTSNSTSKRARTNRYSKKRTYKKTNPSDIVITGCGFPRCFQTTLRYKESINMSGSAGALTGYVYVMNGLYDPNYTSTGHQPMYFDQFMAIYDHYLVIGAKIKCTFANLSGGVPVNLVLSPNDDTTITPASFTAIAEQSGARSTQIAYLGGGSKSLNYYWSMKKEWGANPAIANLQGNATANPTETSCVTIAAQAADGVSSMTISVLVEMEFITQFSELRDIGGS